MSPMYCQFITRFQEMASLLSDLYGVLGDYVVFWYYFMSEIVDNINGYVFIDICGIIWVSTVGLLLGGTVWNMQ